MNCLFCENLLQKENFRHNSYYIKHYCTKCNFKINEINNTLYIIKFN